ALVDAAEAMGPRRGSGPVAATGGPAGSGLRPVAADPPGDDRQGGAALDTPDARQAHPCPLLVGGGNSASHRRSVIVVSSGRPMTLVTLPRTTLTYGSPSSRIA